MRLKSLVDWYEHLSEASLSEIHRFYREDASFRDPFNEVQGRASIERIFLHMFATTQNPRFSIREVHVFESIAWLTWWFEFGFRGKEFSIAGASRLEFDDESLVVSHRDYWDSMDLLVELPWVGKVLSILRRKLGAPQE